MAFYRKALWVVLLSILVCIAVPAVALNLISPTDQQVVREKVDITLAADALPDGGYISLYVSSTDKIVTDSFTIALSPDGAIRKGSKVTFAWDSKTPFRDELNPKSVILLKDGTYTVRVNVHNRESKVTDYTTIQVVLKNKIVRSSPAPGILLQNKLALGQSDSYDVKATAQVYSDQATPILGALGLAASMSVYQTVEDVWPDGSRLLRYKLGQDTYVTTLGSLKYLYPNPATRPQLYKLVNPTGNVVTHNVFARQKMFSVMDILPVLPNRKVKEGDSWNDAMTFKVDGVTEDLDLKGTAVLDSFEWEQGRECAKVISNLSSDAQISLLNGRLSSDVGKITAKVTSFIDYKRGKCLKREILMDYAALIQSGLESGSGAGMGSGPSGYGEGAMGGPGGIIPGGAGAGMPGGMMRPGGGGAMPGMPGMGGGGAMPGMPGMGGGGAMPGMPGMGGGGAMPGMPGMGGGGAMPGMPGMGGGGAMPARPDAEGGVIMPGMGGGAMPGMPGMGGGGAMPGMGGGMPGMGGGTGMPGMGTSGAGGALNLNNATKGSVQLKVVVLLIKR